MGQVIAVGVEKGGTGKTSTVVALSAALSRHAAENGTGERRRMLIVDADSQGHAGKALSAPRDSGLGVADVIWGDVPIGEAIRREPRLPGVDVLAPSRRMAEYDMDAAGLPDRERVIEQMLAPVREEYDLILCDLPPGLGLLHIGMHVAADWVLAPCAPEADSVAGLVDLRSSLERSRDRLGARARLLGVLLTQIDFRTREHTRNVQEIRDHLGGDVLESMIRMTTRVREASRERMSVIEYAPQSTAARDYVAATSEILIRLSGKGAS